MRILVYGGTGRVGTAIVAEAVSRGHDVVAASRHEPVNGLPAGARWQYGDAADPSLVAKAATDVEVVVSALGPSREPDGEPFAFADIVRGLADAVGATRLVVVGGAGSLQAAPGVRLVDTAEFPAEYKAEALAGAEALAWLVGAGAAVDWTYLSPAPVIEDGPRTGGYAVSDETPAGGWISFADYAVALVDELERPAHRGRRFTVASR